LKCDYPQIEIGAGIDSDIQECFAETLQRERDSIRAGGNTRELEMAVLTGDSTVFGMAAQGD
jgi:hypothetical protein